MVPPSQSQDRPSRRRKYKYKTYHTRHSSHRNSENNIRNNSNYNSPNRYYSNYNESRYNKNMSSSTPIVSPSFQRVCDVSNPNIIASQVEKSSGSTHNSPNNYNITSLKQSRYQPHLSNPVVASPISTNNINNKKTKKSEGKLHKSRYDPTPIITSLKTYNCNQYYLPTQWRANKPRNNKFNEFHYNTFTPYKRKRKHSGSRRLSKHYYTSHSSITQSYIKPQAKMHHLPTHQHIELDYSDVVPTPRRLSNNSDNASLEPHTIASVDITHTPLSPTSENEKFTSSKENSVSSEDREVELLEELSDDENETIYFKLKPQLTDYNHISDPYLLKTNLSDFNVENISQPYPKNGPCYSKCIFPLNRLENELWNLKLKLKQREVEKPKYLLAQPFTSLSQYSSYYLNLTKKTQFRKCTNVLVALKYFIIRNELNFRKKYREDKILWNRQCEQSKLVSESLRAHLNMPIIEHKSKPHLPSNDSFDSNHLTRADYVNDDELDEIMCEIDPGYKYNKQAAHIPSMISNPLERNDVHFANVNNLFTNKNQWASRLVSDKIDTFSKHEHDLFIKGYLRFPKRFGKISHFMGGLRTSEDCVLHYYRTKSTVNYKNLIKQRNMSRTKSRAKSFKKLDTSIDEEDSSDGAYLLDSDAFLEEEAVEEEDEENMEEEEVLEDSSNSDY